MPEASRKNETLRPQLPARTGAPLGMGTAPPKDKAPARTRAPKTERRDTITRHRLAHRITMEYQEMPGLRLTMAQAQRLFGLRRDICSRVLDALVDTKILRRDPDGAYARNDVRA